MSALRYGEAVPYINIFLDRSLHEHLGDRRRGLFNGFLRFSDFPEANMLLGNDSARARAIPPCGRDVPLCTYLTSLELPRSSLDSYDE